MLLFLFFQATYDFALGDPYSFQSIVRLFLAFRRWNTKFKTQDRLIAQNTANLSEPTS